MREPVGKLRVAKESRKGQRDGSLSVERFGAGSLGLFDVCHGGEDGVMVSPK